MKNEIRETMNLIRKIHLFESEGQQDNQEKTDEIQKELEKAINEKIIAKFEFNKPNTDNSSFYEFSGVVNDKYTFLYKYEDGESTLEIGNVNKNDDTIDVEPELMSDLNEFTKDFNDIIIEKL